MSHGKLREDPTCLNCGQQVEERFCTYCGQENVEPRQPFHYLFTHFFEDFTHYDGQFWKTLRYLFFRPGELTNIYLSGKRQTFVPPVKLYIFVSFITFFLPSLLPSEKRNDIEITGPSVSKEEMEELKRSGLLQEQELDKVKMAVEAGQGTDTLRMKGDIVNLEELDFMSLKISILNATNRQQYDSLASLKGDLSYRLLRPVAYKYFDLKEKGYSSRQVAASFRDAFVHTIPKAIFIYLPVFAFLLWLFHNKKRWLYFDHGVFTLYFFSFLLLTVLFCMIMDSIPVVIPWGWLKSLTGFATLAVAIYCVAYFFMAHKRVYQTSKKKTLGVGLMLFLVNSFFIIWLMLGLLYFSFLMIH